MVADSARLPVMRRTPLLLAPLLLTGCLRGCGAPVIIPDEGKQVPVVKEEAVTQSPSLTSSGVQEEFAPSSQATEESPGAELEDAPLPDGRNKLSQEDRALLIGLDSWYTSIGKIEESIRRWFLAAKRGEDIDMKEVASVRENYERLHRESRQVSIPPEHPEAREVIQAFDEAAGRALSLLSSPPKEAELEQAVEIFRSLIEESNTMNRIMNEILY